MFASCITSAKTRPEVRAGAFLAEERRYDDYDRGKRENRKYATVTKQKDGEVEGFWRFTLERVALDRKDDDGEVVTSAVAVPGLDAIEFEDASITPRQHLALYLKRLTLERFD